jgi:serine-type D-Ala-D-Ala carboxypeptidase/endopeptidase (penicillin-binding protein 4)
VSGRIDGDKGAAMAKDFRDGLTRRGVLAGLLAAGGSAALADAPLRALRPVARPQAVAVTADAVVAAAGLSGGLGYALVDLRSGTVLDQRNATTPMPPASVAKVMTALYALDAPGPDYRFATRLIATGPLNDGIVAGDLVLAGGGDPVLDTDHFADLAAALRAAGVRGVSGGFQVWGGALPFQARIDANQQEHLGYNPAVSGLNLNFNRVHFEWARTGGTYRVSMDARSERFRPDVSVARMRVVDRQLPVYTYAQTDGLDDWTVARAALGDSGSRWLPVRRPALYAGDVFRTLAAAQGVTLPPATEVHRLVQGTVLATHQSDSMTDLARDMLLHSTNLTAEALGLSSSIARGVAAPTLAASGRAMSDWAVQALGVRGDFVDHSGLGDASRVSASEMAMALVEAAPGGRLRPILRNIPMQDQQGDALANPPGTIAAKTGTLNFVSGLAGYLRTNGGADLAFAIFSADLDRRTVSLLSQDEVPAGSREWARKARRLQHALLRHWSTVHRV